MFQDLTRSRLYGLCPKGINTPFVESLLSYLIRLAEVHAVHLGDLLAYEIAPILEKQYLLNSIEREIVFMMGLGQLMVLERMPKI